MPFCHASNEGSATSSAMLDVRSWRFKERLEGKENPRRGGRRGFSRPPFVASGGFSSSLVHVADEVDAAADYDQRRNTPKK